LSHSLDGTDCCDTFHDSGTVRRTKLSMGETKVMKLKVPEKER
jgi:hypothetical protein